MAKKLDRLYIRVDAHFPRDERYQALPYRLRDSAYLFFEALNGWSRDKRTDGRVPLGIAHALGREMEHPRAKVTAFLATLATEDVGLVELLGDYVYIRKYEKWQDTKAEIEGKQAAKQEAGRAGGVASGRSRREANASSNGEAPASDLVEADAKQTKHQTETETETECSFASLKNSPPAPPGERAAVFDPEELDGYSAFLAELGRSTGRSCPPDAISRNRYLDRRRDGFTAAELEAAARGVASSKFHMGLNDSHLPHNDPDAVLRSKSLRQFIGWGTGEIGLVREETPDERRDREWAEASQRRAGPNLELQA